MAEAMPSTKTKPMKAMLPPDPLFNLKGDMGLIHSLCFPTRDYVNTCSLLLASTEDGFLHFWNLDTNRKNHKQNMGNSIQALHAMNDNLITQEKSGTVKLWSLRKSNYQLTNSIQTYGGFCKSLLINNDLIVPQEKSSLDVVHIANMEKTRTLCTEVENVGSIMCLTRVTINSKDYILGAYESGDMVLWDLETTKAVGHTKLFEHTTSISYDSLTSTGVAGNVTDLMQIFHIDKNSLEISVDLGVSIPNEGVNIVKIREDSKVFVAGCWDNRIRYFSWKTLRCLAVLTEHRKPISDIQFSPHPVTQWNSTIMAAGGQDGVISLWNLYM